MRVFRSAFSVGFFTLISRILGFIRDMMVANYLGAGMMADIWVAAFRFPNLFRRIIAEGAFSSAFIPIYGDVYTKQGAEEAEKFTANILSIFGLWVFGVVVVCQILMPYLIYLISPGFSETFIGFIKDAFTAIIEGISFPAMPDLTHNDKIATTVTLTIICLPYAGCMFLAGMMSGILNYHHKFAVPAFTPALLNMILCLGLISAGIFDFNPLFALGYAVCIAGIVQMTWLYVFIRRLKIRLYFGSLKANIYMQRFKTLFWDGFISGGVIQINILIGSMVASMQEGATSYLYYADRVYQLPLSIVGTTLGVILLPVLVREIANHNITIAKNLLARATEFAAFLTLPAAIAMIFLSPEITFLLFERGAFTPADSQAVANILIFYGFGLPAFILVKLYEPAFYARHDTKTPMIFAVQSIFCNIILSVSLFAWFGFYAIAFATITASWLNALRLLYRLHKQDMTQFDAEMITRFGKIFICCLGVIGVILLGKYFQTQINRSREFFALSLMIVSLCFYFMIALTIHVFPKEQWTRYLKRQKK